MMETEKQPAAATEPRKATHSLKQCTPEEIAAFPSCRVKLTHLSIGSRGSKAKRESYNGSVQFLNFMCHLDFTLTESQFELAYLSSRSTVDKVFMPTDAAIDAKVRPVKVAWPAANGREAHDQYLIDVVLCEDVQMTIAPTKEFVKVFDILMKKDPSFAASYSWFVRIPGESDKEEALADKPQSDVGLDQ